MTAPYPVDPNTRFTELIPNMHKSLEANKGLDLVRYARFQETVNRLKNRCVCHVKYAVGLARLTVRYSTHAETCPARRKQR